MPVIRPVDPAFNTEDVLCSELAAWHKLRPGNPAPDTDEDVIKRLHHAKPAALCISGGGIRSATFGLGVLQGLARKGLLQHVDYISTVSGGGYIGSWLSSWIARRAQASGDHGAGASRDVFAKLAEGDDTHPYAGFGESDEIKHLRSYSNYLTPRLGLFSADTWTLAATYLRNLIVNWFVLIPFILAFLAVGRIWMSALALGNRAQIATTETLLLIAGATGLVLVAYLAMSRPVPGQKYPLQKDDGERPVNWRFAIFGPGMLVIQALAMCFLRAIDDHGTGPTTKWWAAMADFMTKVHLGGFVRVVDAAGQWLGFSDAQLLICLALSVMLLNHIGWAIYNIRLGLNHQWKAGRSLLEFFGAAVAGAAAGYFLWFIILKLFADPMSKIRDVPESLQDLRVEMFVCFAPALYLLAFFVQTMMFVGISCRQNEDDDREWWARWAGWLLIVSISCIAIGSIAVFGPLLIAKIPKTFTALGGITGVVTLTLGRSGASPATQAQVDKGWRAWLTKIALAAAAPVFIIVIFSTLSYVNSWLLHNAFSVPAAEGAAAARGLEPLAVFHFAILRHTELRVISLYTLALFAISLLASVFVQVNRFSMHGLYRNRLTRAYLGASNIDRAPNPFTGFDEQDNVQMSVLPRRPFHIINVALNLVNGENLAWQERKAASFTISPLHCGSDLLGYRPSSKYAGITLGTAVAISGAAVSPNMGYHSSPVLSLLLTLFNVRLGWWLGNPRGRGYTASGPYSSLITILAEALGKTKKDSRWIYLSDGGHFDNLGLYEMVRRRCHYIVVSDAGRDPEITFEDLGNAIRKIRIDLGIPITIDDVKIYPRDEKKPGRYYATGTIHYAVVDEGAPAGVLVYIKPAIYGGEPIDIRNYAAQNVEFPHESTSDQWFTESQFESYRALGAFVVDEICKERSFTTIEDFVDRLKHEELPAEPRLEIKKPAKPQPVPSPSSDVVRSDGL